MKMYYTKEQEMAYEAIRKDYFTLDVDEVEIDPARLVDKGNDIHAALFITFNVLTKFEDVRTGGEGVFCLFAVYNKEAKRVEVYAHCTEAAYHLFWNKFEDFADLPFTEGAKAVVPARLTNELKVALARQIEGAIA